MKTTKQFAACILWLFLLLSPLAACADGRQDGRVYRTTPIQETVVRSANEDEPLAKALVDSSLFVELDDYPLSLLYISEDAFSAYLAANGLSETEFLTHTELDAFLSTLIVPNVSIGAFSTPTGTFETVAGTEVVTSDKGEPTWGGALELTINNVPATVCFWVIPNRDGEGPSGTICTVTEAPSSFTW